MLTLDYRPHYKCCGLFKTKHVEHQTTGEVLKCKISELQQVVLEAEKLTLGDEPKEMQVGKYSYISCCDPSQPEVKIYQLHKQLGKGANSSVTDVFDVSSGMHYAYKRGLPKTDDAASPSPAKSKSTSAASKCEPPLGTQTNKELVEMLNASGKTSKTTTIVYEGEAENIRLIKQEITANPELQQLLPVGFNGPYLPVADLIQEVKWKDKVDLVLEKGDVSLHKMIEFHTKHKMDLSTIWTFATQLLSILRLFEKMGLVHADFKAKNAIINLKNNELKLIDFDVLVRLPPNDSSSCDASRSKAFYTRLYYTKKSYEQLKNANTSAEVRKAWLYHQRVTFAHTFYELFRLAPFTNSDEQEQQLAVAKKQRFTELDITQTISFKALPENLQNFLNTLMDEELPSLDNLVLDETAKKSYKKTFTNIYAASPDVGLLVMQL